MSMVECHGVPSCWYHVCMSAFQVSLSEKYMVQLSGHVTMLAPAIIC